MSIDSSVKLQKSKGRTVHIQKANTSAHRLATMKHDVVREVVGGGGEPGSTALTHAQRFWETITKSLDRETT